jgi:hypothetical protein
MYIDSKIVAQYFSPVDYGKDKTLPYSSQLYTSFIYNTTDTQRFYTYSV